MTRFFTIIILGLTACNVQDKSSPFDNCDSFEQWTLEPLTEEHLRFEISFPSDWQTKLDFVNGDTVSVTAMDTVEYLKTKGLRILSVLQYGTSVDLETNFNAIKGGLITYSKTGMLTIDKYEGRYMLRDEYFEADTVTNLIVLLQTKELAINVMARVTKRTDNTKLFCDFEQILKTIKLNGD